MQSLQQKLTELEDKLILGEILESDYQEQKRLILQRVRATGETIDAMGHIDVGEVMDSRNLPFCHIAPGSFYFGPEDELRNVKAAYYISKYPVTVREFREFLENVDINYSEEDYNTLSLVAPDENCPASHVSYNDAKEFCRWLRRETGEYYSLPHEVEWEKAARGVDGRFFPWGNRPPKHDEACFQGEVEHNCTVPVMTYQMVNKSPYGCVDMVGNTWEWCLDTFDDERDPHILRGGSWCNDAEYANCLARTFSFPPTKRVDYGGFRTIYLPSNYLDQYREAYEDLGKGTRHSLNVVGIKATEKKSTAGNSTLSKAFNNAAKVAAGETNMDITGAMEKEGGESSVNDAMAMAISQAANMYLRKDESEKTVAPVKNAMLATVAGMEKDSGILPEGVGGPKYKSIEELRQEREEARQESTENTLEFDEDERLTFERAKPIQVPASLTYVTVGIWTILLIAVIAAFIYRINQ